METKITLEYEGKKYERIIEEEEFCMEAIAEAIQNKIDPLDVIITYASLGSKLVEEGTIKVPENSEIKEIS